MLEAFLIVPCFGLPAAMALLLARMSPFRRSKLGVPFREMPALPGAETECVVPPRRNFVQLDVRGEDGDENVVEFANRWRSKWRAANACADLD